MAKKVLPIPKGYHAVTPYLAIKGAAKAIDFYKTAFGATERFRMPSPDGKSLMHAELQLGDSVVMLADEFPGMGFVGPKTLKGTPVTIHLYVADVDATFKKAVAAGAKKKRPVEDQFYGDRSGTVVDPFGHVWHLSTHVKDVTPEELQEAAACCEPPAPKKKAKRTAK
jgi:PhnB protein